MTGMCTLAGLTFGAEQQQPRYSQGYEREQCPVLRSWRARGLQLRATLPQQHDHRAQQQERRPPPADAQEQRVAGPAGSRSGDFFAQALGQD